MHNSDIELSRLLDVFHRYVEARNALLDELRLGRRSNRDPLSEFSEWLVARLTKGKLAESSVQKDWDVETPTGEKIQVKYLANSGEFWVNEHEIRVTDLMDSYAIVIYEMLMPQAVVIFPVKNLAAVGAKLGKRHPNQEFTLQFTRRNYISIREEVTEFRNLGIRLYLAPDWMLV